MTNYYVDSVSGSDSNPGSPTAPWASLEPVKTRLANYKIRQGDTVLFKRGSIFYDQVPIPPDPTSALTGQTLIYRDYGIGARPIFRGYKLLNIASGWTEYSSGIWSIDLTPGSGTHTGNVLASGENIGHLLVDEIIRPVQVRVPGTLATNLAQLQNQWDFYTTATTTEGQTLYVKSSANPTTLASSIGAAVNLTGAIIGTEQTLRGLDIDGWGIHNVRIRRTGAISRSVKVQDCRLRRAGGSRRDAGTGARVGNSVEVWIGTVDTLVENCILEDCYDVGYTLQGDLDTSAGWNSWERATFRYNTIIKANQGIEFWSRQEMPGGGFKNVEVHHNVFIKTGYSWGDPVRPDTNGKATNYLFYRMLAPVDIRAHHNLFVGFKENHAYVDNNGTSFPAGFRSYENVILGDRTLPVQYGLPQTMNGSGPEQWSLITGQEIGSQFLASDEIGESAESAFTAVQAHSGAAEMYAQIAMRSGYSEEPKADFEWTPPPASGQMYAPMTIALGTYNALNTLAMRYVVPDFSDRLGSFGVTVSTAGSAGAVVRGGIYLPGAPGSTTFGTLVADLGALSATSTGYKEFSAEAAKLRLQKGQRYLFGVSLQGSPTTAPVLQAVTGFRDPNISTSNPTSFSANRFTGVSVPNVTGALPATIASADVVNLPASPDITYRIF